MINTEEFTEVTFTRTKRFAEIYDLNKEFFDRWAANLVDTPFKQCKGAMTNGTGTACCLHVLECNEQNNGEWFATDALTPSELKEQNGDFANIATVADAAGGLPVMVDSVRVASSSVRFVSKSQFGFAALNDSASLTFAEIAKLIKGESVTVTYSGELTNVREPKRVDRGNS